MDKRDIDETIENIVLKIVDKRKQKGLSIENVANELNLSNSAYNKIEKQDTKLTVERLLQLSSVLSIPIEDFFDLSTENVYNQNLTDHAVGHQEIQNMYQSNMDLTEKFVSSLKEEIEFLRSQLNKK